MRLVLDTIVVWASKSRYGPDGFLKVHNIRIEYTVEDFRREMEGLNAWDSNECNSSSDASPANYLTLVGQIDVLPAPIASGKRLLARAAP